MIYVKYMPYKSIRNASRNKREMEAARESGYEVLVFSNDDPAAGNVPPFAKGYHDGTVPMPVKGSAFQKLRTIVRNRLVVYRQTRKLPRGVWSCHDLHSLRIAYFATRFCLHRPTLIYDAHEFELGRNAKRSKLQRAAVKMEEKTLMKHCAFSIMVNDSIADEVQRIYKLKQRPLVVRSTPNYWQIDEEICRQTRQELLGQYGCSISCMLMYHGVVVPGRGVERLLEALAMLDEKIGLVILGDGQPAYMNAIRAKAESLGVSHRIIYRAAVPLAELWKYVGAVDISCAPIELVAKNHYYSLPNKFFESIQARTPIIASAVPEMKRIIEKYGIGLTCKPGDAEDLSRCVRQMWEDKAFYQRCKANLVQAKEDLCWEKEKQVLINAFRKLEKNA